MNFRDVLEMKMKEMNLTVQDIVDAIGCSKSYNYDLLKGARRFNEELESKICDRLGIKKVYVDKTA